jgi:hypothetical protein
MFGWKGHGHAELLFDGGSAAVPHTMRDTGQASCVALHFRAPRRTMLRDGVVLPIRLRRVNLNAFSGSPALAGEDMSVTRTEKGKVTVHTIAPNAVFTVASAAQILTVKTNTLPREIRLGRLRAAKRAGRHFILGAWLLEWLAAGEVKRRKPAEAEQPQQAQGG